MSKLSALEFKLKKASVLAKYYTDSKTKVNEENGLSVTESGITLAISTPASGGTGGSSGAVTGEDKETIVKCNINLVNDVELGSWFGYTDDSEMVLDTLPSVSDDPYSPSSKNWFKFRAMEDATFQLSTNDVEYSLDDGVTWESLESSNSSPTIASGETIAWRGTISPSSSTGIGTFSSTGNFIAEGNPLSMVFGNSFERQGNLTGKNYVFYKLFNNNEKLISSSGIDLSATTLSTHCYQSMFDGCTNMVDTPDLNATDLSNSCYRAMFKDCESIATAPELPASVMQNDCYREMFKNCISLTEAPELNATILANDCYRDMFNGCENLETVQDELPATILASGCYRDMFKDCESLEIAPELPAETLVSDCYREMFKNCTNVMYIACLATDISASNCTTDWVEDVSASGVFVKNDNMNAWTVGDNGEPNGWDVKDVIEVTPLTFRAKQLSTFTLTIPAEVGTSLLESISYSTDNGETWVTTNNSSEVVSITTPVIQSGNTVLWKGSGSTMSTSTPSSCNFSATGNFEVEGNIMSLLKEEGYASVDALLSGHTFCGLFKGNIKLVDASKLVLHVNTLAASCYSEMFSGCTHLATAPELPATVLANYCYTNMFNNCTSLTVAPDLPATVGADGCYSYMFNGCTGLSEAPDLALIELSDYCYLGMFIDCSSMAEAPELPVTTLTNNCYLNMFINCTSLTEAPELPATTLSNYCYTNMFNGCTSLTKAPLLPATTLTNSCYLSMFAGCTSLNYIKCLATDISATNCTAGWVTNVASSGTFIKDSEMSGWTSGVNGIPSGWTALDNGVSISDSSFSKHAIGGSNAMSVTSTNENWSLSTPNTWLTVSPISGTTGTTNVTVTVEESDESSGRTGTVVFTDGTFTKTLTVSQSSFHDEYLTLDILSGGTMLWKAKNNVTRTISYSLDDGDTWTEITSTNAGVTFPVSEGDKVLLKGTNSAYGTAKDNSSGFASGTTTGTAVFNVYGNTLSLVGGDNFSGMTTLTSSWTFHNLFATAHVVSAKYLALPAMTLTSHCYRAMFSKCHNLIEAPLLPATTLAERCYSYMFDQTALQSGPDLPAPVLVKECYQGLFERCGDIHYIRCLATNISASNCTLSWVTEVPTTGTFVKATEMTGWTVGGAGIPSGWTVVNDSLLPPTIDFDGFDTVELDCESSGTTIYYRLGGSGEYSAYTDPVTISGDTLVEAYSEKNGDTSPVASENCVYVSDVPIDYSNRSLDTWKYNGSTITTPYSVNAINGHSSDYTKNTYNFETSFGLKAAQPTYLWFQHADQSADIYVDNVKVDTHWGGYNAFFSDISNYVHSGTNEIKVAICNTTRNTLAPCAGDFNFNATLGNVKLLTSPVLPDVKYGYDGFHITSDVTSSAATIYVKTTVPSGATVVCTISGGTYTYTDTNDSNGQEMTFTTTISGTSLHLWEGVSNPYLYDVTIDIYHNNELYHTFTRPYGFRFYEYLINDTSKIGSAGSPYTGFALNGHAYQLRGVCMHSDIEGKANALTSVDIANDFTVIQELGCNFIRLAHYPHPKEVYDWCDRLGIVVQTEVPWVNQSSSGQPADYYTHLAGQYDDMVNQHYNHPSIMFWGLANEITPSTVSFTKGKLEEYKARIKALDSERLVGFVFSHSYDNPSSFGSPDLDWFGGNIYVGWYVDKTSNNPTSNINKRLDNTINKLGKPYAYSEYGAGGTQHCHSDDFMTTTTSGNYARHDIEYQMWLHEGHIAAIRNFPQLLFSAQWQLFDVAVSSRNEGYTVCLDGINATTDNNLKYLNNKGLVERDHQTKKDTFYIYKAEWSDEKFVHICCKDYIKNVDRAIKCYTNDGNTLTMYVNGISVDTATVTDHIATFSQRTFSKNDVVLVTGTDTNDTFTFKNVATE